MDEDKLQDSEEAKEPAPVVERPLSGSPQSGTPLRGPRSRRLLDEHRDARAFIHTLHALTPRVWVTHTMFLLNVLVFVAMVATGVSPFDPGTEPLLDWGANFGPLTLEGQWWRLLTCAFLHIGLLHLAVNMWCLWIAGPIAERLFGNAAFLLLYLLSALGGSVTSLAWNPSHSISAGASGAIFGIFGGLIGFLLVRHDAMPVRVFRRLWHGTSIFVLYNIVFGFVSARIDNAGHLGGLATGILVGALLSRAIATDSSAPRWRLARAAIALPLMVPAVLVAQSRLDSALTDPRAFLFRGMMRIQMEDFEGAIADLTGAVQLDRDNVAAYDARAYARFRLERYDLARDDYAEVLRLDSDRDGAWFNRGLCRGQLDEFEGAVSDLGEAIARDPTDAKSFFYRGVFRVLLGEHEDAQTDLDEAIRLEPDLPGVYLARADAKAALGDDAGALSDLDEGVRRDPESVQGFFDRGGVRMRLGDPDGAVRDFSEAIRLADDPPDLYSARARAKAMAGDRDGALADFTKAATLEPEDLFPPIWIAALGGGTTRLEAFANGDDWPASLARFLLGRMTEDELLEEAQRPADETVQNERLCEAHGYLGLVAERDGDLDSAREHYRASVATGITYYIEHSWSVAKLRRAE